MSIRDDLIQDIRKGMNITITRADGTSITGETIKIDRSSIKIKTKTSIINILVSAVESYEIPLEQVEETFKSVMAEKKSVTEEKIMPEIFTAEINYCISMLTTDDRLYLPTTAELKKSYYDDELLPRSKMLGIISLWDRAVSESDEIKRAKKCDAVIQGVTRLYNEKGHFAAADLLARIYFEEKKYDEAAKWFMICDNSTAVYVSLFKEESEERFRYIKEYIVNSEKIDAVLLLDILEYLRKKSAQRDFIEIADKMKFDENSAKLQLIFCGLLYLAEADKKYIEWANDEDLYTESNYKLLVNIIGNESEVSLKNEETIYRGIILSFDKERKYGFISDTPSNTFFRIEQVSDKKLMDMLLNKKFKPNYYHVSYVNARNAKGKRVADKITLLERAKPEIHTGYIASYIPKYKLGYIKDGNKSYSFKLDMVIDPFLKVYLENKHLDNSKVTFYVDVLGTKEIAAYVAMEREFSDQEAMYLLEKNVLSEDDFIKWNNYKKYGPFYEEEPLDEEVKLPLVDYVELGKC